MDRVARVNIRIRNTTQQPLALAYVAKSSGLAACAVKVKLPADTSVDAEVDLGKTAEGNFQLAVRLNVNLPGLDEQLKRDLVETAHQTCPYSRMTRGNADVQLIVA